MNRGTAVALALVLAPFARATAEDPKSAASRIDVLVRGLESNDAAVRARAADDLGRTFPDGARAVPVLVDATTDDDAEVRKAAVTALRRLGRAGLEVVMHRSARLSSRAEGVVARMGWLAESLASALTHTDLSEFLGDTVARSVDEGEAVLFTFAARPPTHSHLLANLGVVEPWLSHSDRSTALAAAAALAILGRAAVSDESPDDVGPDLIAPPALAAPLRDARPAVQWLHWSLVAQAAPLGDSLAEAVLGRWREVRAQPPSPETRDLEIGRPIAASDLTEAVFLPALAVAARQSKEARAELTNVLARGRDFKWIGNAELRLVSSLDDEDVARAWSKAVDQGSDVLVGVHGSVTIVPPGRVPEAVKRVSGALAGWIAAERVRDAFSKQLLAAGPSTLPDVPDDPTDWTRFVRDQAHAALSLAALTLKLPSDFVEPGTRDAGEAAFGRALTMPGYISLRCRAADELRAIGPVAASLAPALLVALSSRNRVCDANLLEALASVGGVPASATSLLIAFVATPRPESASITLKDVIRFGKQWPYVAAARAIRADGASAPHWLRVRLAALDSLGRVVGDRSQARAALKPLLADADAQVRYRAARALRRLGT